VQFRSGDGSHEIYQWTLELWKQKPSSVEECDGDKECVRVQVESGGLIDSAGKKIKLTNADGTQITGAARSALLATASPHSQPIKSAFVFKGDELAWYKNKNTNLKEAIGDAKTVWLRVETCRLPGGEAECKKNWLDSISYEITIGEPEEEPEPVIKGCKTVAECKAILDLEFIRQVFGG